MTEAERPQRPEPRRIIRRLCSFAVLAFAAMIGAGLIGGLHPAFDYFSHFQVHLFLSGLLLGALCLRLRARRHALIALALCAVPVIRVAPYWYQPNPLNFPPDSPTIRVMSANVRTQNARCQEFMEEVRRLGPDVLAIIEVSQQWEAELAPLIAEYPFRHSVRIPGDRHYGVMILSRLPLTPKPLPLMFRESGFRCAAAEIDYFGNPILCIAAHPMPPIGFGATRLRDQQLALANGYVRKHNADHTVILGDLNTTPWSHGYRTMIGGTTLRNTRLGLGVDGSWPAALPRFMQIPIDHILVSEKIAVDRSRTGSAIGSDHLPVIADIVPLAR